MKGARSMSDEVLSQVDQSSNASNPPVTAGLLLKAARESQGLHIAALAVSMKVPVKKLEALEADRFDLLPDAVFVRALASSVCRALKLDPTPILQLLPLNAPHRLIVDDRGINTPFDSPGYGGSISLPNFLRKPTVLMVLVLMLGAVAVYFYPETTRSLTSNESLQPLTETMAFESTSEAIEAPAAMSKSIVQGEPVGTTEPSQSLQTLPTQNAAELPTGPAPSINANLAQSAIDNAKQDMPASAPVGDAIVSFKAKGEAWVQVTDAKGLQLLSRTLQPSEAVGISGALPLSVVVGRADLTTVEVRGKVLDLGAIAQSNVARFEVKP